MQIRTARKEDYGQIYRLVQTAFSTAQVSDGTEQDFVLELRRRPGYIPGLELEAEENGRIVGHIMLTEQAVEGRQVNALLLAPLCVALEYRNRGMGGQLIRAAFAAAGEMGYTAVFLIGNPDYYGRFGFRAVTDFGLANAAGVPDRFVQACELTPGALDGTGGSVLLA